MPKRKTHEAGDPKGGSDTLAWTPAMDDVLIDAFLHQHNLGNRVGGNFTPHAYHNILQELKMRFNDKSFDKGKIKNRIKYIKRNFSNCYDLFKNGMSGFAWNPVTKMWCAEPEVWQKLIEVKPKAAEWMNKPIPNYEKLVQLYGHDRARGEHAETVAETRQRRANSSEEDVVNTINVIDHMVSQNEVNLRSFDVLEHDALNLTTPEAHSRAPSQGATSSKDKKSKSRTLKDDIEFEFMREGFDNVAEAIMKSTADLTEAILRSTQRLPISEREVWDHLVELGIEPHMQFNAYLFLIQKPDMVRAFLGCPMERRKELLLHMMFGPSIPPSH